MNNLNEQLNKITELIQTVCDNYPKDNEKQYKAFMYVLVNINPAFRCSIDRYTSLKKSLAVCMFDKDDLSKYQYEQKVYELLGIYISIGVL